MDIIKRLIINNGKKYANITNGSSVLCALVINSVKE
jgi:hypothetical protein